MEVLKLIVSFLTPITVAAVGYLLNQRLKSIDEAQWQNRKIIEKRLELYDVIAPDMNKIFCFCLFLGYWKDVSPRDAINTKRELDRQVNIYRHLLSEDFYNEYNRFIHIPFQTFTGHGADAKIRAPIANQMGDRRKHHNYDWDDDFVACFQEDAAFPEREFNRSYLEAMNQLRNCVGLKPTAAQSG